MNLNLNVVVFKFAELYYHGCCDVAYFPFHRNDLFDRHIRHFKVDQLKSFLKFALVQFHEFD